MISNFRPDGTRYDFLSRALHWNFAVGILYATFAGYSLRWIQPQGVHDFLSFLNISIATLLIPLFIIRLTWKLTRVNPEPPPVQMKQLKAARIVQNLIYLAIFLALTTGYFMIPVSYSFFGLTNIPTPFGKGRVTEFFTLAHSVCVASLTGLFCLHIVGVCYHMLRRQGNFVGNML